MAQAQARLPNRNGMSTDHALWPGARLPGDAAPRSARKPDVRAAACMKDCATEERVASFVPDYARDAHGNLAEQNRLVGAQKGAETAAKPAGRAAAATASASPQALLQKNGCLACHAVEAKVLGPSLRDVRAAPRRPRRRRGLPGGQDQGGRRRRVGRHPDARTDPERHRCPPPSHNGWQAVPGLDPFRIRPQDPRSAAPPRCWTHASNQE